MYYINPPYSPSMVIRTGASCGKTETTMRRYHEQMARVVAEMEAFHALGMSPHRILCAGLGVVGIVARDAYTPSPGYFGVNVNRLHLLAAYLAPTWFPPAWVPPAWPRRSWQRAPHVLEPVFTLPPSTTSVAPSRHRQGVEGGQLEPFTASPHRGRVPEGGECHDRGGRDAYPTPWHLRAAMSELEVRPSPLWRRRDG